MKFKKNSPALTLEKMEKRSIMEPGEKEDRKAKAWNSKVPGVVYFNPNEHDNWLTGKGQPTMPGR